MEQTPESTNKKVVKLSDTRNLNDALLDGAKTFVSMVGPVIQSRIKTEVSDRMSDLVVTVLGMEKKGEPLSPQVKQIVEAGVNAVLTPEFMDQYVRDELSNIIETMNDATRSLVSDMNVEDTLREIVQNEIPLNKLDEQVENIIDTLVHDNVDMESIAEEKIEDKISHNVNLEQIAEEQLGNAIENLDLESITSDRLGEEVETRVNDLDVESICRERFDEVVDYRLEVIVEKKLVSKIKLVLNRLIEPITQQI